MSLAAKDLVLGLAGQAEKRSLVCLSAFYMHTSAYNNTLFGCSSSTVEQEQQQAQSCGLVPSFSLLLITRN
jgi:hypothetical protein